MSTRKITVFSTGSKSGTVIETGSVNWGALQGDLRNKGVSFNGMKAIVGKTKVNLEHTDASLPDEDFTLFLFPEKTKSGLTAAQVEALPYKALRDELKRLSEADGEKFKSHFNVDKNYTTKGTDVLKALLISYSALATKTAETAAIPKAEAKAVPAKATKEKVAQVVDSLKTSAKPERVQKEAVKAPSVSDALDTDEKKLDFIVELIQNLKSPTQTQKNDAIYAIASLRAGAEIKGKGKEFVNVDNKALLDEAKQIARGVSGIKEVY